MMKIERYDSGPRASKALVHGAKVYLGGLYAEKTAGKSTTEQTKEVLAQIDGYLAKCGTDKSKLLSAHIWLANMATFDEMNKVWEDWISPGNPPSCVTIEAKLPDPRLSVEIMVVAAK